MEGLEGTYHLILASDSASGYLLELQMRIDRDMGHSVMFQVGNRYAPLSRLKLFHGLSAAVRHYEKEISK